MNTKIVYLALVSLFFIASCTKNDDGPTTPVNPSVNMSVHFFADQFEGTEIVVIGSAGRNFIVSFLSELPDGTKLNFVKTTSSFPSVMDDEEGNAWDVFGSCVRGPRLGQRLTPTGGYLGFWFAWGAMYPGVEIHEGSALDEVPTIPPSSAGWSIAVEDVSTGQSKDGIPSIEDPVIIKYKEKDFLETGFYVNREDLVVGAKVGDKVRLYPHAVLNWHELVNDELDDIPFTVSFCPLTGTATGWNRTIGGTETTFGVSGLLYNSNLITYDRGSDSYWSQMRMECVNGDFLGETLQRLNIIETTWSTWLEILGQPEILSEETGFNRNYRGNPYGSYPTDHNQLGFPVQFDDDRLLRKERVHGVVINNKARVYRFESFDL